MPDLSAARAAILARKAIGCFDMAAAVVGASAVVAIWAAPPSTAFRHCLPEVKLLTLISRPCFLKKPFSLATMLIPEIGDWFCASVALNSAEAGPAHVSC